MSLIIKCIKRLLRPTFDGGVMLTLQNGEFLFCSRVVNTRSAIDWKLHLLSRRSGLLDHE